MPRRREQPTFRPRRLRALHFKINKMRNIFAILLILAAIGIYYGYTKHAFADIKAIKIQLADYNDTLNKANELDDEKKSIADTINSFSQDDKDRLEKLIPDNADNVRLIIDIQNIASASGLSIKNISVNDDSNPTGAAVTAGAAANQTSSDQGLSTLNSTKKYDSVTLSFSVASSYENFIGFLGKLEQSLRLVDVTSLTVKNTESPGIYNFDIELKAYWLK